MCKRCMADTETRRRGSETISRPDPSLIVKRPSSFMLQAEEAAVSTILPRSWPSNRPALFS